jgi:hypothetical protein
MADRLTTITLRTDEIPAYRAAVIACALPHERDGCERLLGQLASLESNAIVPGESLHFAPGRRSAQLADRALARLRSERRSRPSPDGRVNTS